MANSLETATLGGGCFWCVEAVFDDLKGVDAVESGYMGGHTKDPTYEDLCGGDTGHAEVVQVHFDPAVVSYADILRVFPMAGGGKKGPPMLHRHLTCGHDFHSVLTCSECGEALDPRQVVPHPGPGASKKSARAISSASN